MLNSDYLPYEYFTKKEKDWSIKGQNAISYLGSKNPKEIASEFKNDKSFNEIILYINSTKNGITHHLSEKDIPKLANKIDFKSKNTDKESEKVINIINKLNQALNYVIGNKNNEDNLRTAILLASAIATAVILSKKKNYSKSKR